jgi:hypothetical protein
VGGNLTRELFVQQEQFLDGSAEASKRFRLSRQNAGPDLGIMAERQIVAHGASSGPMRAAFTLPDWLPHKAGRFANRPQVCQPAPQSDALLYGESGRHFYQLRAWVIMPNPVHVLLLPKTALPVITRWLKGSTARQANLILGRTGAAYGIWGLALASIFATQSAWGRPQTERALISLSTSYSTRRIDGWESSSKRYAARRSPS